MGFCCGKLASPPVKGKVRMCPYEIQVRYCIMGVYELPLCSSPSPWLSVWGNVAFDIN